MDTRILIKHPRQQPSFGNTGANDHKSEPNDPRSPAELRAAFVELTREIEADEHIGRQNRLVGRHEKIAEQLIAAGGNSEREFLPLLEDQSLAVRYAVAFHVKPFNRARFEAVLRALAESGGEVGRKAHSSLEWAKEQDDHPLAVGSR